MTHDSPRVRAGRIQHLQALWVRVIMPSRVDEFGDGKVDHVLDFEPGESEGWGEGESE